MYLPTCLMYSTGCPPAADYVPYWCHGLEVYPGSCSGLPPRSLLSNPGHQRSQFTPLIEQRLLFVPFARTSTTQARAFSVIGPSVRNGLPLSQRLLPRILSDTFYSSLKTLLFSRARIGSASE